MLCLVYRHYDDLRNDSIAINKKVNVKVKFALEEAMKAQSGSRGIGLLFL